MTREGPLSRRRILQIAGVTVSTATLAGCADGGEGPGEDNETGDEPADGNETAPTDEENETEDENETEPAGEDNETGDDAAADVEEWQDVDEIVLEGFTENWLGVEPAPIDGEENPTLVFFEGQEYDITWENMDGEPHNIEIWDGDEEIVDDYQTEIIEEEGEEQTLTIEASEEMAQYVCEVHPTTMCTIGNTVERYSYQP